MTWIKICGVTTTRDAEFAVSLGASAIGLIFAPSSRQVRLTRAREIAREIRGRAEIVGVFKEVQSVLAVHEAVGLDRVQIHAPGRPDVSLPILRAVKPEDLQGALEIAEHEMVLIDGSEGRGRRFDWSLARVLNRPFVLAGGLTPENVEEAIQQAGPQGVDVTTGVERAPGQKDHERVRQFIEAVRRSDAH